MNSPDLDDNLEDVALSTPEYHLTDEEVEAMEIEYSTRAEKDWVISGPLGGHGRGPGRRFATLANAWGWAKDKYGRRLMGRIAEATLFGGNRWAFLVKGETHV